MQDYLAWRSRHYAVNELADCSSGISRCHSMIPVS